MARKKWTPKEEVTDSLLKFREKRKWQLSLRRYVLEKNPCFTYAPYFGLDIENFRKWIELQFTGDLSWDNFGSAWQFDHIVPVGYFDFSLPADLKLCWNFINIRVEQINPDKAKGNRIDVLAVKPYFKRLYETTGFSLCKDMIRKLDGMEASNIVSEPPLESFIIDQREHFELLATLSAEEFGQLNQGIALSDILLEREILKKFG